MNKILKFICSFFFEFLFQANKLINFHYESSTKSLKRIENLQTRYQSLKKAQNFNKRNLTKSYSVIDANAVFIGLERVSDRELSNLYSTRRMGVHRLDKNFRGTGKHGFYQVLDDFSIPEAYLLQTVVQYFNDEELRLGAFLRYLHFWNKFQHNI